MTGVIIYSVSILRRVLLCFLPLGIGIGWLSVTVAVVVQVVSAVSRSAIMLFGQVSIRSRVIRAERLSVFGIKMKGDGG